MIEHGVKVIHRKNGDSDFDNVDDAYDRKDINALLEWESQNFSSGSMK